MTNGAKRRPGLQEKNLSSSPLLDPLLDTTKPLHKLLLIGDAEEIQALYRAISTDDFPSTAFYLSKANYLEVTAKHVSKEDALVELANHYHLSLEEVLTMGGQLQ